MSSQNNHSDNIKIKNNRLKIYLSWCVTIVVAAGLISILFWQPILAQELEDQNETNGLVAPIHEEDFLQDVQADMPYFAAAEHSLSLVRMPVSHTIAPTQPRSKPIEYEVLSGDAVFSIAQKFNISPETVLWSNYSVLRDDPHTLDVGQILIIAPTNGILHEWKEGDTIETVAREYRALPDDILNWSGNKLDITNPEIVPGTMVMIPGGQREFQQWVVPTFAVGRSGTASLPEGCSIGGSIYFGTGWFVWPADNHNLSGNDFWSGHLAIDLATALGAPIYASDSGVVVYSGWNSNGYGNVIMIDHMNGYHTLYAHLSSINVSCGSSVAQGNVIGKAGSTGNSTGPHLHFEVRYFGGFINPWTVLP